MNSPVADLRIECADDLLPHVKVELTSHHRYPWLLVWRIEDNAGFLVGEFTDSPSSLLLAPGWDAHRSAFGCLADLYRKQGKCPPNTHLFDPE